MYKLAYIRALVDVVKMGRGRVNFPSHFLECGKNECVRVGDIFVTRGISLRLWC